jgi:hypothetical protein
MSSLMVKRAVTFLQQVGVLLEQKNRAYGDAAANPLRCFSQASPEEGLRVRIDDKLSRLSRGDGSGDDCRPCHGSGIAPEGGDK